jgi:hypothetical protein
MALVRTIELRQKDIRAVHNTTTCTYSVFIDEDGTPYLQLETYGSENREIPGKVKQTMQFNQESAERLMDILRQVFPTLGR